MHGIILSLPSSPGEPGGSGQAGDFGHIGKMGPIGDKGKQIFKCFHIPRTESAYRLSHSHCSFQQYTVNYGIEINNGTLVGKLPVLF